MKKTRHIIPISGKDSLCTAILQRQRRPDLEYEYVFNPTGAELPEVFEWIEKVEKQLDIKITRVGEDLESIIESYNYFLPSGQARYCTRRAKIEPFIRWIGSDSVVAYFGIRADEDRGGFDNNSSPNITAVYPLKEMGVNLKMVYAILGASGLKPPAFFWKSVYNEVEKRTGYDLKTIFSEPEIDFHFSWRTRANCFFCFNQRLYEFAGLLEHHPVLFNKAEWYESQGGDKVYSWKKDYPLSLIRERYQEIREKRIKKLIKMINKKTQREIQFEKEDETDDFHDVLQVTSCGLFCGK